MAGAPPNLLGLLLRLAPPAPPRSSPPPPEVPPPSAAAAAAAGSEDDDQPLEAEAQQKSPRQDEETTGQAREAKHKRVGEGGVHGGGGWEEFGGEPGRLVAEEAVRLLSVLVSMSKARSYVLGEVRGGWCAGRGGGLPACLYPGVRDETRRNSLLPATFSNTCKTHYGKMVRREEIRLGFRLPAVLHFDQFCFFLFGSK